VQLALPARLVVPVWQAAQAEAPASEKVLAGHSVGVALVVGQALPAGQIRQLLTSACPVSKVYVAPLQSVGLTALSGQYVPAGHVVQSDC
jgi:hypothetical protein